MHQKMSVFILKVLFPESSYLLGLMALVRLKGLGIYMKKEIFKAFLKAGIAHQRLIKVQM